MTNDELCKAFVIRHSSLIIKKNPMHHHTLSGREIEVLSHLANGMSYKAIADECGVTMDTVRKHLQSVYRKLGVQNNAAAVAVALRLGIIE
jgi:DNA-binding NarL/FixJ family response regulator